MNMRKKILIIDDDPRHLQTTRGLLENAGYEVVEHPKPFGTMEIIIKQRPDLVLLDVNMPGLSGDRLCALVKAGHKAPAILLHSSNDEDILRQAVIQCGANGYVCKGDVATLRRKIAQVLAD
jgi:CheY-like chemotaxis protein